MHLYHWQCHLHQMMLMPAPNTSYDQNTHVAPNFSYLDQTDAMVILMVPFASCDADAGANCITWPEKSCCVILIMLRITYRMLPLMTLMASCDTETNISGITWLKMLCWTHVSIILTRWLHLSFWQWNWHTSCWCQCQKCQSTEKHTLYFISRRKVMFGLCSIILR